MHADRRRNGVYRNACNNTRYVIMYTPHGRHSRQTTCANDLSSICRGSTQCECPPIYTGLQGSMHALHRETWLYSLLYIQTYLCIVHTVTTTGYTYHLTSFLTCEVIDSHASEKLQNHLSYHILHAGLSNIGSDFLLVHQSYIFKCIATRKIYNKCTERDIKPHFQRKTSPEQDLVSYVSDDLYNIMCISCPPCVTIFRSADKALIIATLDLETYRQIIL